MFLRYAAIVVLLACFHGCVSTPIEPTITGSTWAEQIRGKVKSNLVMPEGIPKNAVVKFLVTQLPNGEIVKISLVSTSGFPKYDQAVEQALLKSSPLPKMPAPEYFVREIQFTFTP